MINKNLFKAAYISKGLKQSDIAERLKITENTLRRKIKNNALEIREVDELVKFLEIKNPIEIFFTNFVTQNVKRN